MASSTDLNRFSSSTNDFRSMMKTTPVSILSSKKISEPLNRLKNRANLFRRRNYSSQLDLGETYPSIDVDNCISSYSIQSNENQISNGKFTLKRSNSMICPQRRLQTLLKIHDNIANHRNSVCIQLPDCSTEESSTDDNHNHIKLSNRYFNSRIYSKMSNIEEQDVYSSKESVDKPNNEQNSIAKSSSLIYEPKIDEEINSKKTFHTKNDFLNSSYYGLNRKISLPMNLMENINLSTSKISTSTMTGKSLNNLDECESLISSADKGIQATYVESMTNDSFLNRDHSLTSLSSSSTSIQIDSIENQIHMSKYSVNRQKLQSYANWPRIQERLLNEQPCIYWVNYLGSTAIKLCNDNTSTVPTYAINRLKQSTQYARVLPIIGLSISSRGVEFLKHAKERVVICFHDIKAIHCACQDEDLRYFAYVTCEQRLISNILRGTKTLDSKPPLKTSSVNGDYHNYCHVFVVKNETMSTEILLTFGQAFDMAYRNHRPSMDKKQIQLDRSQSKVDLNRFVLKPNKLMSLSTHSPATTTSSSSSSNEERRMFI